MYRFGVFTTTLYAPIYITIMYFLWRAVFNASPEGVMHGMDWSRTVAYISIAMIIGNMIYSFVDYQISNDVRSGDLMIYLTRPMDFQAYHFFNALGQIAMNVLLIALPGCLYITLVLRLELRFGAGAILFVPSLFMGICIAFLLDYIVGIIAFYTESIFGITNAKGMLLMFFSGQLVPLAFFPDTLRQVAMALPFQAVINTPVSVLTDFSLNIGQAASMLALQVFWVFALLVVSRIFFSIAVKKLTVNGG
jgi:ABC-2 type transport system permease protein